MSSASTIRSSSYTTDTTEIINRNRFRLKDPGSAITHLIGFILSLGAVIPLMIRAAAVPTLPHMISIGIFIISMVLLYGASTVYHSLDISRRGNRILQKIDHMMIFVLIAGSYTPFCIIGIKGIIGVRLLIIVWAIALGGMLLKAFWITCPKWFSSIIYIALGWACLAALPQFLEGLPTGALLWLLAGGIIYTIGGIVYALKLPLFEARHKNFGVHEIFHLFVMGGSLCHFISVFVYLAVMP